MKKSGMQKLAVLLMVVFSLSLIAGCGGGKKEGGQADPVKKKKVSLATAASTGAWFSIGGGMANTVTKFSPKLEMTAEVSGGSAENFRNLASKTADLAMVNNDLAHYYYTSTREYTGKGSNKIRGLWPMFYSAMHVVVPADSNIKTIKDFKGKRIATGQPGSGYEAFSKSFLKSAGITYDDIDEKLISPTQMPGSLKDGQIDGFMAPFNVPVGALTDLAISKDVRFLNFTKEEIEKFRKENVGFWPYTIKANTYKGQSADLLVPAQRGVVITSIDNLTEDEVYEIVKNVWEHRENWKNIHNTCNEITLDTVLNAMPIPLHKGAIKYYREKGITIPAELIPPEAK